MQGYSLGKTVDFCPTHCYYIIVINFKGGMKFERTVESLPWLHGAEGRRRRDLSALRI